MRELPVLSHRTAPHRSSYLNKPFVLHDHGLAQLLRGAPQLCRSLLQRRFVVFRRYPLLPVRGDRKWAY